MLARSRDTGRITSTAVLGRAVTTYFTTHDGNYPPENIWSEEIVETQDIGRFPSGLVYANGVIPCGVNTQPTGKPTYCYDTDDLGLNGVLIFSKLETYKQNSKCTPPQVAYSVYSSADGKNGIICSDVDPVPWEEGTQTYVE